MKRIIVFDVNETLLDLERLRASGFRLVTLTDSAPTVVRQQLTKAGLIGYFERVFSVDAVQRFKPAPDVYGLVARDLTVAPNRLRLVAAYAWDVLGALRAGCADANPQFVDLPHSRRQPAHSKIRSPP